MSLFLLFILLQVVVVNSRKKGSFSKKVVYKYAALCLVFFSCSFASFCASSVVLLFWFFGLGIMVGSGAQGHSIDASRVEPCTCGDGSADFLLLLRTILASAAIRHFKWRALSSA